MEKRTTENLENKIAKGYINMMNKKYENKWNSKHTPQEYEDYKNCCIACKQIINYEDWMMISDLNDIIVTYYGYKEGFPWDMARQFKIDTVKAFSIDSVNEWYDYEPGDLGDYILTVLVEDRYKDELDKRGFKLELSDEARERNERLNGYEESKKLDSNCNKETKSDNKDKGEIEMSITRIKRSNIHGSWEDGKYALEIGDLIVRNDELYKLNSIEYLGGTNDYILCIESYGNHSLCSCNGVKYYESFDNMRLRWNTMIKCWVDMDSVYTQEIHDNGNVYDIPRSWADTKEYSTGSNDALLKALEWVGDNVDGYWIINRKLDSNSQEFGDSNSDDKEKQETKEDKECAELTCVEIPEGTLSVGERIIRSNEMLTVNHIFKVDDKITLKFVKSEDEVDLNCLDLVYSTTVNCWIDLNDETVHRNEYDDFIPDGWINGQYNIFDTNGYPIDPSNWVLSISENRYVEKKNAVKIYDESAGAEDYISRSSIVDNKTKNELLTKLGAWFDESSGERIKYYVHGWDLPVVLGYLLAYTADLNAVGNLSEYETDDDYDIVLNTKDNTISICSVYKMPL